MNLHFNIHPYMDGSILTDCEDGEVIAILPDLKEDNPIAILLEQSPRYAEFVESIADRACSNCSACQNERTRATSLLRSTGLRP
jgi:hypothetical protein